MRTPAEVQSKVTQALQKFGMSVTVSRVVKSATPTRDIFGKDTSETSSTFTTNIIPENDAVQMTMTMAGMRPMVVLTGVAAAGTFNVTDEIQYQGHTYQVREISPATLSGQDVAETFKANREVD